MDNFLLYALIAGIGFATIAGPLGCFVIWRRMAFFGDTLAHASLVGAALGLFIDVNPFISILGVCLLISYILSWQQRNKSTSIDTWLAIISQGFLAMGIILLSKIKTRFDLNAYLFGDILTVLPSEIILLYFIGIILLFFLWKIWPELLSITVAEDLAAIENVNVNKINLIYSLLLAIFIALSIKIVGVLLITALLILPPSMAQFWAKSPEKMALYSSLGGIIMVIKGLMLANYCDFPAGPAIVISGFFLFIGMKIFQSLKMNEN